MTYKNELLPTNKITPQRVDELWEKMSVPTYLTRFATESWHKRELLRMTTKVYTRIPASIRRPLSLDDRDPTSGFVHMSRQPGEREVMVAYTTLDNATRDRQIRIRFGRYLRNHYAETHPISDDMIRMASASFTAQTGQYELKMARSIEEITMVYEECTARSCMSGDSSRWGLSQHPAAVYSTPDCAVAYVQDTVRHEIRSRSVINMIENTYAQIYGNWEIMTNLLTVAGITQSNVGLRGCRLARVFCPDRNAYVMPYIDGDGIGLKFNQDGTILAMGSRSRGIDFRAHHDCEPYFSKAFYDTRIARAA